MKYLSALHKKPFLVAFSIFTLVFSLTQYLVYQKYLINRERDRQEVMREADAIKDRLKSTYSYALSAVKTLAFVVENYGVPKNFDQVAGSILSANKNIDALELTRKGVITHIYPLRGNESVIGYDILKDSLKNKEANKVIRLRALFFAGPFKLKQGGVGIVGRFPIFKEGEFFGFSAVVIKLATLLKATGINAIPESPFNYQLSKKNPNTGLQEFFLPGALPTSMRQAVTLNLPDGEWKLYVTHKNNKPILALLPFSVVGILLSLICSTFGWYLVNLSDKLNNLVEEKTKQFLIAETKYKTAFQRFSDRVVSVDNNWRYTFLNDAAVADHPLGREATLGKSIWDIHPEMKETVFWEAYHEALRTCRPIEFESYYAPMKVWFSVNVYPSADGLTICYRDITTNKKSQEQILLEKKFSESIINSLPGIFYLYDREGKFLQWNKNFEIVTGYSAEEISGMHPLDFFDVNEKKIIRAEIETAFKTGKAEVEAHLLTQSGKKIPYYLNGYHGNFGGTDYLMGVGIDITERTKALTSLKESEEKYRYLFNNSPAVIIIWDVETWAILEANEGTPQHYGYSREEFLNLTVIDIRPHEDQEMVKNFSKMMLASAHEKIRKIWRHQKKNGELMYMDISSHRINYNNRKAILSLAKDITSQVLAEEQLKETYDDIRRLNAHLQTVREEERTSIAREIHDELGQQLTALKMDIAWLGRKIPNNEKIVSDKLTDMTNIIDATVANVRRISTNLRPGILDDLGLIAALEWQSGEFQKRTGIQCDFFTNMTDIKLGRDLTTGVFRIYQEALTNVMRHANATSLSTGLNQTKNDLTLYIQDNGVGFETNDAKNKRSLGITGMKERALMLGGQLTIQSEKGVGTLVILKIPVNLHHPNLHHEHTHR